MSVLAERIGQLSTDTATRVTSLFDRHVAGQVDEPTFVSRSATTVNRANAQATTYADQATAADLRAQTGLPIRPAGIKPIDDQGRLEGVIRKVMGETPKDATTPDEVHQSIRDRLGRLARNEPSTAAQNSAQGALDAHERFLQGWVREMNGSKACPLCVRWADGVVRSTKVQMNRHHNCQCMPRPVTKRITSADLTPAQQKAADRIAKQAAQAAFKRGAQRVGEAVGIGGGGGYATYRVLRPKAFHGPTIFDRLGIFERNLALANIDLVKGQYMVHGSGLLDALNIRQAADLDVIAHPDLYEQIANAPGWRRVSAGVNKDVEILTNSDLHMQVAKAVEQTPTWRRQITIADLETNTVTLQGKEFIKPDLLVEMKSAAIREGAKVPKNIRDIQLLDGRLLWKEDVSRFGDLLNRSRLSTGEERAISAMRHPSQVLSRDRAELRAQAKLRVEQARRRLKAVASPRERRALQVYGRGSKELNEALRAGARLTPAQVEQVRLMDQALGKQFTPFRVRAYRGLRMTKAEALAEYGDKVGTIVSDPGFTSTGLRESVARKYGQSGVFMEFDIPTGTHGYYAPYRALTSQNLPNKFLQVFGEDELLLPRNLRYEIASIEERADGTVMIHAKVIPTAMPEAPLPGMGIRAEVEGSRITAAAPVKTVAGVKQRVFPPGAGPAMRADLIPDTNVAKTIARQAKVPGFEDLARRKGRDALEEIIQRQVDFVLRSAQRSMDLSPEATELHATWYPFAHGWLNDLADSTIDRIVPVTRNGSYAATAALSPGADWAHNIAWAKRVVDAVSQDVEVQEEWVRARYTLEREAGRAQGRGGGRPRLRRDLIGKRLSEIDDPADVALALRGWHDFEPVMQLGGHAGFGNPLRTARPQSVDNLVKAVKVLRDGSLENIDDTLGGMKVRSFFNNLARPFDLEDLDVTVDTHHYGVANGHPWTTSNRFISSGPLNITDTPSSAGTGIHGTYSLVVEATRRATPILNERWGTHYLPDQIQSIVWEMHRADYPDFARRGPGATRMFRRIDQARTARALGRITPAEEQRLVDLARYDGGAPTDSEILEWFRADLAGTPRPNLMQVRLERDRARKAALRRRPHG